MPAIGWGQQAGLDLGVAGFLFDNGKKDDPFFRTTPYRQQISVTASGTLGGVQRYGATLDQPSSEGQIFQLDLGYDGERVACRVAGKGPVLLLAHSMAGSSVTWRQVTPALARRFTVLAPDLLGQGQSDKPRGEYSLGAHANTLRDLMDTLGHERATVVGQSLGGGVAMQFAYQFPERCERLVLMDSGGLGREVTFYLRMLTLPGFESVFALLCAPRLRDAGNRVATWLGRAGVRSTPASQEIWRSYASLADAESRRAAHLPTLIVWGARDPFIPVSHAVAAHKAIRGSRLEIFDGVGHYPHCEAPQRFVEVLVDFIASTEPAPTAVAFAPTRQKDASQCRRSVRAGLEHPRAPGPRAAHAARQCRRLFVRPRVRPARGRPAARRRFGWLSASPTRKCATSAQSASNRRRLKPLPVTSQSTWGGSCAASRK